MGQHDIGDYFKDRVKGQNKDIDTNEIWANLDLDKKRKRRGAWWMWMMGIGIILIVSTLYFTNTVDATLLKQETTEALTEIDNSIQGNNNELVNKKTENKKQDPNKSLTQTPLQEKSSTLPLVKGESPLNPTAHKKPYPIAIQKNKLKNDQIPPSETASNKITSNITSKAQKKISLSRHNTNSSVDSQIKNTLKPISPTETSNLAITLLKIKDQKGLITRERNTPNLTDNFILHTNLETKELDNKKGELSLNLYTGGFFINRSITSNEITEPIYQDRIKNETPLEMIALGGQLQYKWANNFYAGLGVEYQTINEKYQHQQSSIIDTIIKENQPITYLVSADRDTSVFATGSAQSTIQLNENFTFYNNHRLITIPLTLGYVVHKNRWSIGLEGTLLPSLYNQFKGTTIELDGSLSTNPSYLNTKIKMGYRTSIRLERELGENISLYLKPSYQVYGSSFAEEFSQKYSFVGGLIGLSYGWKCVKQKKLALTKY